MFIQATTLADSKKYHTAFKAKVDLTKFLNPQRIEKQIQEINKDKEAKEVFGALVALAGAAVAEFTAFIQQDKQLKNIVSEIISDLNISIPEKNTIAPKHNKIESAISEQDKSFNLEASIKEFPERNLYLKITSYYPNLDSKYKQLLKIQQQEPNNKKNELTLNIIEATFRYLADEQRLMHMQPYFQTLDEYADCIDNIAQNIASTIKNNQSLMHYLVLLHNGKLTKEDIDNWVRVNNLGCDDFMLTKNILNNTQITNLHNLKNKNNNFQLIDLQQTDYENVEKQAYVFRLNFAEYMSVQDKLKTITQVHEAMHGEIKLKETKDYFDEYILKDLKSELIDSLVKDRRLDATYSFIKYIKPEALKNYTLSAKEIKFLDSQSQTYKDIKAICINEAMNLDENNPKVQEIFDVLNDKEIYANIITSRHAKIRFLSRIVLKDNPNCNLKEDTKEKIEILSNILNKELDTCYFFCYVKSQRNAPQFYIRDNELGDFIKITLNNEGSIHTIFEDFHKEQKEKQKQ